VTVIPGFFGGVLTPMAFAEETVFVPVINLPLVFTDTTSEFDLATATGEMVALRASDGNVRWRTAVETFFSGGATVANDVVFGAGLDGIVRAFDIATGEERWRFQADAGINAALAVAGDMLFVPAGAGLIGGQGRRPRPSCWRSGSMAPLWGARRSRHRLRLEPGSVVLVRTIHHDARLPHGRYSA
jgi:outer membrane protein assembly factor BamB